MTRLVDQLVSQVVRDISAYHVPSAEGMLKLDAMENPWPLPPELRDGWLARLARVEFNRYPDPACVELKGHIRRVFGVAPDDGLVLGNGSDELIQMLAQMIGGAGRTFMSPVPTFSMYSIIASMTGNGFEGVALDSNFEPDPDVFLERIGICNPACIFLAYPNNPTGNAFDRGFIQAVIDAAPGLVVLDEAYFAFSKDTWLTEIRRFDNLLVMRTMSKSGLAGLRLGMLFGNREWTEQLDKVRLPYNINSLTQASAIYCLENHELFERQTRRIISNRRILFEALSKVPGLTAYPSVTNFILVRLDRDATAVWEALQRHGVLVRNLNEPEAALENCLRLTVGTEKEIDQLVTALKSILD